MRKRDAIEMERIALATRARAEATILRHRYLNEILPALLEEYDRRVADGKPYRLALPSAEKWIADALANVGQ